jgi:aspartyl protease family protein
MGLIKVKLTVKNPKDERRSVTDNFLVDSGAMYTVLPEAHWKKIKLKPVRTQEFALADGKIIKRKLGLAFLEFQKHKGASHVVLGKKNDMCILGAISLESMGLGLNPFARRIYETKIIPS